MPAWADAHSETPHPVLADHPAVKVQGPTTTAVQVSADRRGGVQLAAVDRLVQVDEIHLVSPSDPD